MSLQNDGFGTVIKDLEAGSVVVPEVVSVALAGTAFQSIKAAVDSITDAAVDKPYLVQVYPGVYDEDPFTIPPYVTVKGMGEFYSTIVQTKNNSAHFIDGSSGAEMAHLAIVGPTDIGFAAVNYEDVGNVPFMVRHCEVRVGYYAFWCHPSAFGTMHLLKCANHYFGQNIQNFVRCTDFGFLTIVTCAVVSIPPDSCAIGYYVSGPNAEMSMDLCTFVAPGITTDGVYADDSANIKLASCAFSEGQNAIHIGPLGFTILRASGTIIRSDFINDFLIDTPAASVAFQGVADRTKMSIPPGTTFIASFVDRDSASPGEVVIGQLWLGHTTTNSFPLGSYSYATAGTGLTAAGDVTEGAGLFIAVDAGVGYINDGVGVAEITWGNTNVPVSANLDRGWIVVDHTGGPVESLFRPDPTQVISLCSYSTDAISVVGISRYLNDLRHIWSRVAVYDRDIMGPMCISGGIVSKHAGVSLQLDVTDAHYYIYFTENDSIGAAPVTFTYWHQTPLPGSGWTKITGNTDIDENNYDLNGVLTAVPFGSYKRDVLYVTSDGTNSEYHVVYGQQLFAAPPPGDALTNPTPPDFLNQAALRLAAIVCQGTVADILQVIDQRPFLGQYAAPTTGVTIHGSLLGLGADDHHQYQLRTEKNFASGYCGLDATNKVAPAQLDITSTPAAGVDAALPGAGISDELARADHWHQVLTGAPVTIGTANATGAGPTIAMSNHIHAHGNQTVDTLHAVAVAGVSAGFMSSAQATQLAVTVPNTITLTAGAGLTGGGDLSANRTFDVVANADGSITVNADDIQVGTLATDAQHGSRGGGTQHSVVVAGVSNGFMTSAMATQLAATVPNTRNLTAGSGISGGGDLSADRSFDIVANADGSITVNANDIQVGILATDIQHGTRSGGTLHSAVVAGVSNGFMTAAQATQLAATVPNTRTITAGNGLTGGGDLSANRTIDVVANADGSIVANANDIQVGVLATDTQHGTRGGGTIHSAVTGAANGFMIAADKTKLDSLAAATFAEETVSRTQTTAADVLMGNMTLTPAAGTYLITFSGMVSIGTNNRPTTMSIYVGGVQVTASERIYNTSNAGQTDDTFCCQTVSTVNGAQAIEGRWRTTTANTATSTRHTITALRVQ